MSEAMKHGYLVTIAGQEGRVYVATYDISTDSLKLVATDDPNLVRAATERHTTAPAFGFKPWPPSDDSWRHRTANMRCGSCMWFVPKSTTGRDVPESGEIGRCRRHAPTMNGFPAVFAQDWCGDHKLDETKL